ncbi:7035_t:CDS:2 [Gigaspora margarita]|uniref:7035_t:CDS:1 n=1 Tax=Gigaspora margarita TaxID=4874 RepID=A0ABN7ULS1_GIGMA|nr:7035_t:CDS:2 [Gigaspora margarita]
MTSLNICPSGVSKENEKAWKWHFEHATNGNFRGHSKAELFRGLSINGTESISQIGIGFKKDKHMSLHIIKLDDSCNALSWFFCCEKRI